MSEEDKIIEDRFEEVFGRKPGAFPEGTSLEEKVKIIGEKTKELEARKEKLAQEERDNLARLDKQLERDGISINSKTRQERLAEEERANLERIEKQLEEDGISIKPKEKPEEPAQEQTVETSIQTDDEKLNDAKGLQGDAKKTEEPAQERTPETSIQTDDEKLNDAKGLQEDAKKPEGPAQERTPETKKIYPILDKGEQFNQVNKQPDAPLHEHQKQPQQQENTQESQEKADIWSRFTHFVKKVLEKLIGEEDRVEHINNKEIPQKNPADNNKAQRKEDRVEHINNKQEIPQKNPAVEHEAQGKETSFIEINGKKIDLEPGKNFSYVTNDKTLSINITYTNQPQYEVAQQSNLSPASMNLNINGKGYSIPPGESFSYKSNNVEVSITHGHQRERNYDEILREARTMGKGLREHGVQNERANNGHIAPTNTPHVQAKSTGVLSK